MTKAHILAGLTLLMTWAPDARADEVLGENLIVKSELLCVGGLCIDNEPWITGREGLKIKSTAPALLFEDTSSSGGIDWQINASSDLTFNQLNQNRVPFSISSEADENTLRVDAATRIGIGTAFPLEQIHVAVNSPGIRLERTSSAPGHWDFLLVSVGNPPTPALDIRSSAHGGTVFRLKAGAPIQSFLVDETGNIGLGTFSPDGKLHTKGSGVQLAYFESGDGGPVQVRFRTDSENRRFLAVNNANEVKSQIIFKDNEIQFTGATDSGANRWLTIGPAGIVSQGPTCNPGPCDRTFDRDFFTVPPITERAAQMWENRHLPGLGPTQPHAPINLTEKMGGVIHELEVAHIYIEQLHTQMQDMQRRHEAELEALGAKNARQIAEVMTRLDAMEKR